MKIKWLEQDGSIITYDAKTDEYVAYVSLSFPAFALNQWAKEMGIAFKKGVFQKAAADKMIKEGVDITGPEGL